MFSQFPKLQQRLFSGFHSQKRKVSHALSRPVNFDSSYSSLCGLSAAFSVGLSMSLFENNKSNNNKVNACGIIGMVGEENVVDYLLEGLTILQNRGYDSAGLASLNAKSSDIKCTKYASGLTTSDSLDKIKQQAPNSHSMDKIGIAHTRWATHGAKTDENAHPHLDYSENIAIVHNGTIENCFEIKKELQNKGIEFVSQTDTEVIANLIGYYLNEEKKDSKNSIEIAFEKALQRLDGSWGIAMLYKNRPNEIFAARHGSPLMIGIDEVNKRNFIASEHSAFSRHTNQFIALNDGEMAVISGKDVNIINEGDIKKRIEKAPNTFEEVLLTPDPFPHWTLKEIYEGPTAILNSLSNGSRLTSNKENKYIKLGGLENNIDRLLPIKNLVITGCGTSLYAGQFGKKIMNYLNAFNTVQVVDAAEMNDDSFHTQRNKKNDFGVLAITQSGETKDVVDALQIADEKDITKFSVVNVVGSLISRMTNLGVYTHAGREYGVASTKAFLSQVTVLTLIAGWFSQYRSEEENPRIATLMKSLQKLSIYCGITLNDCRSICKKIAKDICNKSDMFVLGKGFGEPIAYEGALKIKEITYCHCEGYSGGALKHGPFALIEKGTPIIMIILDDEHGKVMKTNAQEIIARGGKLIIITDNKSMFKNTEMYNSDEHYIVSIPKNGILTALLAVVPLQLIAYEMAVLKGINPDKPKNLAKAVTVV